MSRKQRLASKQRVVCATLRYTTALIPQAPQTHPWLDGLTLSSLLLGSDLWGSLYGRWAHTAFPSRFWRSSQLSCCCRLQLWPLTTCRGSPAAWKGTAVTNSRGCPVDTPGSSAHPISLGTNQNNTPLQKNKHTGFFPVCLLFCLILQTFLWCCQRKDLKLSFSLFRRWRNSRLQTLTLLV